ncbi:hypothetical protein [Clostridium perfringens]|uniref:hypothetical protein n=1 Tax=Clostridium perfringens TaxID=1502 RepID=UPI00123FA85C|nr:hypothetical protein [Clostridium perfringens]EHK2367345.1 hypothetical protein [Clostridium perfringens]MDK0618517.1 hypothetical protein [Clostridium perfringens]MDM0885883.1 hypothetical protein [Clostridium perfringens]MDU4050991.1 hypothetical protein [Clostridium perfringens]
MDFDLRTCDSSYFFLLEFLNMESEEYIMDYNVECNGNFEVFWEKHFKEIDDVDISDLRIMGFHVVGSLDKCVEIRKNGLKNLKKVLSQETMLNRVLRDNGVIIDVKSKKLYYNGNLFDIDYEKYRGRYDLNEQEQNIEGVAHRIYYDFCVDGFMVSDDVFNYGTDIHKRPEFILNLVKLFPSLKSMEDRWCKQSTSYRVDFYAYFDQLQRFTFDLDEESDPNYNNWTELTDEQKLKKWMLSHAIDRINSDLGEVYLYVKDDLDIPPEQILNCIPI